MTIAAQNFRSVPAVGAHLALDNCAVDCSGKCVGLAARHVVGDAGEILAVPRPAGACAIQEASETVALGLPDPAEHGMLQVAVREARRAQRPVEVRLGVGPLRGAVPLRVLGHATLVARTIATDVRRVAIPRSIVVFSSEHKAGRPGSTKAICGLTMMALALRLSGLDIPVLLEIASPMREVPARLADGLSPELSNWLRRAQIRSASTADAVAYAAEHASASMFGDLCDLPRAPLRITIGGTPEGRFWAVRRRVRLAAVADGWRLAPTMAFIIRSVRVPWYHPHTSEPALVSTELDKPSVDHARAQLYAAANPSRGGNGGLMAEIKATERALRLLAGTTGRDVQSLTGHPWAFVAAAAAKPDVALQLANNMGFVLGPRLTSEVYR